MSPCPHCGNDAPIVYRGVVPQCTACGHVRPPLSSPSVNLAGKSSRVGGAVASVFGWLVLLVGCSVALGVVLLLSVFHAALAGLAIAAPIAVVSLVLGIVLVRRGASLQLAGIEAERATREQALLALAAHRGSLSAVDAAHALGVSAAQADAMLTELAKREPERLAVDVSDQGVLLYRFVDLGGTSGAFAPRVRVDEPAGPSELEEEAADELTGKKEAGA